MEKWMDSVYSDGTDMFVSNPQPKLGEIVRIRIRMYENAPVKHVLLKSLVNGAELIVEAKKVSVEYGLAYYEAELKMAETRMQYQFYLVCDEVIYYYNQKEITTYIPDLTYDFVLLTDYKQPEWVKEVVFYQIFPERFYNGNTENDVQSEEYMYNGHSCKKMENWNDTPLPYEKGFCMDFFGGDLEGVQQKIPYLKRLGVTAIYLNPIFTAPSIHKYDCIDFFHVDEHFGGDEVLAELSKALHENDMKLILDISINHTGAAHKWFNKECEFFDKSQGAYHNPDSEERSYYFFEPNSQNYLGWANVATLPTLNYTSEALRDVIYRAEDSVLKKWLKEPYNIDGWRFDVADVFARNNEIQLAHELWPEIRKSIRKENDQAYILAEDWGDCGSYLQGKEWDSAMNYFGFGRVFRQFLGLPDLFLERNPILKSVSYKMTAEDVKARIIEHLSKIPFVIWENQFNLFDSHDVPRVHNFSQVHPMEYKGMVMMQFTMIGTPNIYYGDEIGIAGDVKSDDGYRYPMVWDAETEKTEIYQFYQKLAQTKNKNAALRRGGMKFLYAKDQVLAIARFYEDDVVITLMSVNERDVNIQLPIGTVGIKKFIEKEDLFGNKLQYSVIDENTIELFVPAHQGYVVECKLK